MTPPITPTPSDDAHPMWSGQRSRHILKRIVVEGRLTLQSPAHLGNGDGDSLTDMPLLLDPLTNVPLITGTSLAGALRSYLMGQYQNDTARVAALFGMEKGATDDEVQGEEGKQSALIVEDAIGDKASIAVREGVALAPKTRTAKPNALFNLEVWQAGAHFPLRFELLICAEANPPAQHSSEKELRAALATALQGMSKGQIKLGARKHRGYGCIHADQWQVTEYDLTQPAGLLAWLGSTLPEAGRKAYGLPLATLQTGLNALAEPAAICAHSFEMAVTLAVESGILVRGNTGKDDQGADLAHLHGVVLEDGLAVNRPIISGPSWAGAIRARMLRIAQTLTTHNDHAQTQVNAMFGSMDGDEKRASRIITHESAIQQADTQRVQNRISIDRFTGGALESALFNEQPALPLNNSEVACRVVLLDPKDHEIGLLLLVLKDLCTGDLPLGGTIGIGRGRLRGKEGTLCQRDGEQEQTWKFAQQGNSLTFSTGQVQTLNNYVRAANTTLQGEQ